MSVLTKERCTQSRIRRFRRRNLPRLQCTQVGNPRNVSHPPPCEQADDRCWSRGSLSSWRSNSPSQASTPGKHRPLSSHSNSDSSQPSVGDAVGALVPGAPDGDLDGGVDGPAVGVEEGLAVTGLAVVATVVSSRQMSRYSSPPSPQSSSPARVGDSNGPSNTFIPALHVSTRPQR